MKKILRQMYMLVDNQGIPIFISSVHERIHDKRMYEVSYKSPEGGDVADNATIIISFAVGTEEPHLTFGIQSGGDVEVEWLEGSTVTGGTPYIPRNLHRRGLDNSPVTVLINPTVSVDGTTLHNSVIGGGTGGNAGGGSGGTRPEIERPLDADTTYVLRLTNRAGGAKAISAVIDFYIE